jgi:hypothetical protein
MVSRIVIEAEGLGNYETALGLSIDGRLIAENLTPEKALRLVGGFLDGIAVALDVGENAAPHWTTEFGRTRRH